jgi:hypothetical protein
MRAFEQEVVRVLAEAHIPADVLDRVLSSTPREYQHTGVGYFLTVQDQGLPASRVVLTEPLLCGKSANAEVGFVVFLEDSVLTLECHGWGDEVPLDFRDQAVSIAVADPGVGRGNDADQI